MNHKNRKIGILTWHKNNFGSELQAYALQQSVRRLGPDVEIIDYVSQKDPQMQVALELRCMLGWIVEKIFPAVPRKLKYSTLRFHMHYLIKTKPVVKKELTDIAKKYDVLITGSDQIWAPNVLDTAYMLDFIDGRTVKKVSYAASIGLTMIPDKMVDTYRTLIGDYKKVSIREYAGKELLYKRTGIDSQVVLDPTLLPDIECFHRIEQQERAYQKPYIFCYFLNAEHQYRAVTDAFAMRNGLEVIGWSAKKEDLEWMTIVNGIGTREFLWYIHHAAFVFTDSYHGTIFSLRYHRPFFTFERFATNDPINQNTRIYQLVDSFSIGDRIITNNSKPEDCHNYDYEEFEKQRRRLAENSMKYLKEAIDI